MSNNLIAQAVNLKASYGERLILNGVNLDIVPKKITTIIGGSGSGKTTLLKHFIGLQRQVAGEVTVIEAISAAIDAPLRPASRIAVISGPISRIIDITIRSAT